MTPKDWSIEAFETCDHGGMICMSCAERAISAAIEEARAQWLCGRRERNGDEQHHAKGVSGTLTSAA